MKIFNKSFFYLDVLIYKKYKNVSFISPAGKFFLLYLSCLNLRLYFSFEFSSSTDRLLKPSFLSKIMLPFLPTKTGVFV